MPWIIAILSGALLIIISLGVKAKMANPNYNEKVNDPFYRFDDLFIKYGLKYSIDWKLLKAVALTENINLDPNISNPSDPSYGLMQILMRSKDLDSKPDRNEFPGIPEYMLLTPRKLFDPETNIRIAVQILKWNMQNFGYPRGVAKYNLYLQDVPMNGPFKNQVYMNRFFTHYDKLRRNEK